VKDLHDTHEAEIITAQIEHNNDIVAAQVKYSIAVQTSREKLAAATQERQRVWHGEAPSRVDADALAAALGEDSPSPVIRRHLPGTPEHEAAVERAIADGRGEIEGNRKSQEGLG
jgi:hypothetical protein